MFLDRGSLDNLVRGLVAHIRGMKDLPTAAMVAIIVRAAAMVAIIVRAATAMN